jgi:hypothetical protein
VVAVITGLVNVEECDHITLFDCPSTDIPKRTASLRDGPDGDVPRDDRKRDVELAMI